MEEVDAKVFRFYKLYDPENGKIQYFITMSLI